MNRLSTFFQGAWQALQDITEDSSVCAHPYFTVCHHEVDEYEAHLYWEAKVRIPFSDTFVHITIPGAETGPTAEDAEFCGGLLTDLTAVYRRCQPAIDAALSAQGLAAVGSGGQNCVLEAIGLPEWGVPIKAWEVCFWLGASERYAVIQFENDIVRQVIIEP